MLSLKEKEFVEAGRALGASDSRILARHLLPNCIGPIIVNVTLTVAAAILTESALSFLGFGVQSATTPTWGNLLADTKAYFGQGTSWLVLFPGLAIVITVLSVNFLGDGLRDALDPQAGQGRSLPMTDARCLSRSRGPPTVCPSPPRTGRSTPSAASTSPCTEGETLGIVGESGRASSVTMLAVMGLLPKTAQITGSATLPRARSSSASTRQAQPAVRGQRIAMIFQDPLTALNPVHRVGDQIAEAVLAHQDVIGEHGQDAGRSRCSTSSASPSRRPGRGSTRTSSPAACASGR